MIQSEVRRFARRSVPTIVSGAVAGLVIEAYPHPNADRLRCVVVDVGGRKLHIVHGGTHHVQAGDLVPVAPPGAVVLDGKRRRMRARTYRGERSEGMCCSSDELGWTVGGPDVVHVLSTCLAPGTPLVTGGEDGGT